MNKRIVTIGKQSKSESIVTKLLQTQELISAKSILLYSPIDGEVDISKIFSILQNQRKNIFLPKVADLKVAKFIFGTSLIRGKNGVFEPAERISMNPKQLDIAIIPGLGFDRQGNRIGHGGGWYDRIIDEINFKYIIGVCFDSQLLLKVPQEPHDKSVHMVITEKEIINTRY